MRYASYYVLLLGFLCVMTFRTHEQVEAARTYEHAAGGGIPRQRAMPARSGAVQWCLSGLDRDSGAALEVLLSGAARLQLPAELAAAELHVSGEAGTTSWELRGNGTR